MEWFEQDGPIVPVEHLVIPENSNFTQEFWQSLYNLAEVGCLRALEERTNTRWDEDPDVLFQAFGSALATGFYAAPNRHLAGYPISEPHFFSIWSAAQSHTFDDIVDNYVDLMGLRDEIIHSLSSMGRRILEDGEEKSVVINNTFEVVMDILEKQPSNINAIQAQRDIISKIETLGSPNNSLVYKTSLLRLVMTGMILTENTDALERPLRQTPEINQTRLVTSFVATSVYSDPIVANSINLNSPHTPKSLICANNSATQGLFNVFEPGVESIGDLNDLFDALLGIIVFETNFQVERRLGNIKFYDQKKGRRSRGVPQEQPLPTINLYTRYIEYNWRYIKRAARRVNPSEDKRYAGKFLQLAVLHNLMAAGVGSFDYNKLYKREIASADEPTNLKKMTVDPNWDYSQLKVPYQKIVQQMLNNDWVRQSDINMAMGLFAKLDASFRELVKSRMLKKD